MINIYESKVAAVKKGYRSNLFIHKSYGKFLKPSTEQLAT